MGRWGSAWSKRDGDLVRNIHERQVADGAAAWALLHRVTDPDAQIWPTDGWPPLELDQGLVPGSRGGHGPVRYQVEAVTPEEVRFTFIEGSGLRGWHGFRRIGDRIVHELTLHRPGPLVELLVMPLHDTLIEDLLDDIEARLAGITGWPPRRWTRRVRALRAIETWLGRTRSTTVLATTTGHRPA